MSEENGKRIIEAVASMAGTGRMGRVVVPANRIGEAQAIGIQMCLDAGLGVSKHPEALREAQLVGREVALKRITEDEGVQKIQEIIQKAKASETASE